MYEFFVKYCMKLLYQHKRENRIKMPRSWLSLSLKIDKHCKSPEFMLHVKKVWLYLQHLEFSHVPITSYRIDYKILAYGHTKKTKYIFHFTFLVGKGKVSNKINLIEMRKIGRKHFLLFFFLIFDINDNLHPWSLAY